MLYANIPLSGKTAAARISSVFTGIAFCHKQVSFINIIRKENKKKKTSNTKKKKETPGNGTYFWRHDTAAGEDEGLMAGRFGDFTVWAGVKWSGGHSKAALRLSVLYYS